MDIVRVMGYGFALSTVGVGLVLWVFAGVLVSDAIREARMRGRRAAADAALRRGRSLRFRDYLTPQA